MTITPATEMETTRDMISAFGGYNHTMNCGENEFYMEKNMTSDYYPALAPRRKRRMLFRTGEIYGMYAKNGILLVEDGNLLYTDKEMNDWQIIGQLAKSTKVMCGMGAYVAIWPDKKIFNTNDKTLKDMEASKATAGTVTFSMCTLDGADITPITKAPSIGTVAPQSPKADDLWLDTSSTPHVIKKYTTTWTKITTCSNGAIYWMDTGTTPNALKLWSESENQWTAVATSYTKISNTGIGKPFEKYDVVKIDGVTGSIADTFNQDMAIWDKRMISSL